MFDYFDRDRELNKRGTIDLTHCEEVLYKLKTPQYQHVFGLRTKHRGQDRNYYLAADTEEEMNEWVSTLCRVLHLDNECKLYRITRIEVIRQNAECRLHKEAVACFGWYRLTIPKVHYFESPLCRYAPSANVWVKVKIKVRFMIRVRVRIIGLGSALGLGLGLVGIVDFQNSGPSE